MAMKLDEKVIVTECMRKTDADFIAHAREDVPALVAEVEKLQDLLRVALPYLKNHYDEKDYTGFREWKSDEFTQFIQEICGAVAL